MNSSNLRLLQTIVVLICSVQMYAQPTFKKGHDPKPNGKQWVKVENLSDEFNGTSINTSKWGTSVRTWIGREPGLFTQEAISVADGNLKITNSEFSTPRKVKEKEWTHGCGLVTSKESAKVGYYLETRMKASKTFMSSTFWLINVRNEGEDCDRRTTELDINEVVGQITKSSPVNKMNEMGSNTHSRNTACESTAVGSKGNHVDIGEEAYKDYHIYAAWWKSKSEIQFFLDGKYVYSIEPVEDFNLPMYIRMVTETYNWNPVPEDGGMKGTEDERTTFYDWTRTWKLQDAPKVKNSIYLKDTPLSVVHGDDYKVNVSYKTDSKSEIVLTVNSPDGTKTTESKKIINKGSKTVTFTINQAKPWSINKEYLLELAIRPIGGDINTNKAYLARIFEVTSKPLGSYVSIQNLGNKKYVSSENIKSLACNKANPNKTEIFEIIDAGKGLVAFKGSNAKYISSENGKGAMTCLNTKIGDTEKFTMVDYGNDIFVIKGNNNKHVRASMQCTGTGASEWLKFKFVNAE